MTVPVQRYNERPYDALRPIGASFNAFGYAPGTVLFEMGRTKVLCAVSMQPGVPHFLKGQQRGWLTAEYAMLPTSTTIRTQRDGSSASKNGRSVEISRFIARCLRTAVDLKQLGERTIVVDCDVLQADAGTRTACITGSSLALRSAVDKWLAEGVLTIDIMMARLAAVSVGWVHGQALLDLDFAEDGRADADFNVVMTDTGHLVEMQGAVEGKPLTWEQFEQLRCLAIRGIENIFQTCTLLMDTHGQRPALQHTAKQTTGGVFSLGNRLHSSL
jgi:ribonuclease PH